MLILSVLNMYGLPELLELLSANLLSQVELFGTHTLLTQLRKISQVHLEILFSNGMDKLTTFKQSNH